MEVRLHAFNETYVMRVKPNHRLVSVFFHCKTEILPISFRIFGPISSSLFAAVTHVLEPCAHTHISHRASPHLPWSLAFLISGERIIHQVVKYHHHC